jgi:hypothetical protein
MEIAECDRTNNCENNSEARLIDDISNCQNVSLVLDSLHLASYSQFEQTGPVVVDKSIFIIGIDIIRVS